MKIRVMSDIHLEFDWHHTYDTLIKSMEAHEDTVLVVAGDLGLLRGCEMIGKFLNETSEMFKYVICISGNHEVYHYDKSDERAEWEHLTEDLDNVHWLENDCIWLDGVKFIGSTFWSDISKSPEIRNAIHNGMNDFHLIKQDGKALTPDMVDILHEKARNYVFEQLNNAKKQKTVVITHHNPTMRTAEEYRGNALNSAYGTDYEKEIEAFGPNLWIYGHTHVSAEYTIGDTKIVCNPRGYITEDSNRDFNPNLDVEV